MIETIGMVAAIVIGLGQLYLIERGLAQMAQSSEERREENRTQTKLLADIGQGIRDQAQAQTQVLADIGQGIRDQGKALERQGKVLEKLLERPA